MHGPHAKKFCRSEKCGMESFVTGFSHKYPCVPAELNGKLSHLLKESSDVTAQAPTRLSTGHPEPEPAKNAQWSTINRSGKPLNQSHQSSQLSNGPKSQERPKLRIGLSKGTDGDWSPVEPEKLNALSKESAGDGPTRSCEPQTVVSSVAGNVTSFINGIRASFRSENVVISMPQRSSKSNVSANLNTNSNVRN